MAVYNRIGGGMNKVTLNGKIPPKRVNLKSVDTITWHENFLPERLNNLLLNQDGKIIFLGEGYALWEKEFGKPRTQIGSINPYSVDMFFIQDEIKYIVKNKSEYNGSSDTSIVEVYKIENGVATLLSTTYESKVGTSNFEVKMYLKNEIYAHGKRSTVSSYRYFKSKDFGVTWTEITNQIVNNTNQDIESLFTTTNTININDTIYLFKGTDILKFDGKTFDVFKKDANIKWFKKTKDFTNRDLAHILDFETIYATTGSNKTNFTFYKLEKNSLDGIDINIEKTFECYMPGPQFINTKDLTCYIWETADKNLLCFKKYPVSAYIEE